MQSYLTNRKQKVRIDQRESEPITITMGVPQGTTQKTQFYHMLMIQQLYRQVKPGKKLKVK